MPSTGVHGMRSPHSSKTIKDDGKIYIKALTP